VLSSKGSKELFQQSHKGKQFSLEDLQRNIVEVINLNLEEVSKPSEPKLIYKEPVQVENDVMTLKISLSGKIEDNRKEVLISQQKQLLPTFKADPDKLVGKKIKHKCRDPVSKTVEWFKGEVVEIFQYHENVLKIEYNVRYDDDDDEDDDDIWHFPLLKDMENGDIIINS
jgi:DNA-directed RNA polymerase subunit H (RpoH/RPB5)